MEKEGFGPRLRSTVFEALSGRQGADPAAGGEVKAMLLAAFGPASNKYGVDTAAAAKGLGVSRRTVERYVTDAGQRIRPRGARLHAIVTKARQAATTKRGRAAAISQARKGPMSRYGAKLTLRGTQGPRRAGQDYMRPNRVVTLDLDPDAVAALWAAYEQGGDKAFVSWLEDHADQAYVPGWEVGSIDELHLGRP